MDAPVVVDETDLRILQEFLVGDDIRARTRRIPAGEVAAKLGIHENTVGSRLKRLQDVGFGLPLHALCDWTAVGLRGGRAHFEGAQLDRRGLTLARVHDITQCLGVLDLVDGIDMFLVAEDDAALARIVEQARIAIGATSTHWEVGPEDWTPPEPGAISRMDVRILQHILRNDAPRLTELAEELGVTTRALEKRLERLRDRQVIRMYPGGTTRFSGLTVLMVSMDLSTQDWEATTRAILRAVPNNVFRHLMARRAWLAVYGSEMSHLLDQVALLETIPGVSGVRHYVLRRAGVLFNPHFGGWLANVLDDRIQKFRAETASAGE